MPLRFWRRARIPLCTLLSLAASGVTAAEPPPLKQAAALYPAHLIEKARDNIARYEWARQIAQPIIESAQPWMKLTDDQLWDLMFGNTIKRSWMVWSNGHCPGCMKSVPMYDWKMDALNQPWKTRCPYCQELFPKNDFQAFYRSGLDEHGVFQPARADRSLLFNSEHPGADDPLRTFGVDDGEGYVDGEKRWRFIGAYLIYGQWKQAIVAGIRNLAAAYAVTGDTAYAHKAGVLFDRVADLYPTFDFGKEGVMYEGPPRSGYVSTWHDACWEVRDMCLAYDQVFEALRNDDQLVRFLAGKAARFKLDNPKKTFAEVQRNIESRILRDTLANRPKIESNYPQTDMTIVFIKTVLEWPANRAEVMTLIDGILKQSTAVDGMTGEKGLAGYTVMAPRNVAEFLGWYMRVDEAFLRDILQRHPGLHAMYRFHIDTWCLDRYYPMIGDTGRFAQATSRYIGVVSNTSPGLAPSSSAFLWQLYEQTKDDAFVKVLFRNNDGTVDGLPFDLFADDPAAFQQQVRVVIEREGTSIDLPSIDKQQWHLAILRGGEGEHARALWLDYDSGERHGHADAMNLGLFARGLDFMPDFGYPPVQFGGWGAPRAVWYTVTAAHNTVMVDGQNTRAGGGKTTLWADGQQFHAIRASAPQLIGGKQYERTVAMVDISDRDFYVIDVFRVVGGTDHLKFMRSHFGTITTEGVTLTPAEAPPTLSGPVQMRAFRRDEHPRAIWSADWTIEDRYKLLPAGSQVRLRYFDLTPAAAAYTAESWVTTTLFEGEGEAWIPTVMIHRRATAAPLASTFVSVIEPYEKSPNIAAVRRLELTTIEGTALPDSNAGIEVESKDGTRDLWIAVDVEDPLNRTPARREAPEVIVSGRRLTCDAELCWVRLSPAGAVLRAAVCRGSRMSAGDATIDLARETAFIEVSVTGDRAQAVAGDAAGVDLRRGAAATRGK